MLRRLIQPALLSDTATAEIYTLSLHDALPISAPSATGLVRPSGVRQKGRPVGPWLGLGGCRARAPRGGPQGLHEPPAPSADRKSTRLNSSHGYISYAVFCLKKKTQHPAAPSAY